MKPTFFARATDFRAWLTRHHLTRTELLVGFYKVGSGRPSMTWPESVDQALCFGWIDGVRRRLDELAYTIRFTPRRAGSTWSAINIRRVAALKRLGLMQPAGLEAFTRRIRERSRTYSYEQRYEASLTAAQRRRLKANRAAWQYFLGQPRSYRQTMIFWVASARKEETRLKRLERLIQSSAMGRRLV
jgi:uncharacterized protein YdeI (YjbR/CyaY-like superfamily)